MSRSAPGLAACKAACGPAVVRQLHHGGRDLGGGHGRRRAVADLLRGNSGEVFPHVISALTATLIGDEVRRAQTELFVRMGVIRAHEVTGPTVATGVFGGYLYMNVSTMRLIGARMPGMSPKDAERQVTGTIEELPPYRRAKGDRNLAATLAIAKMGVRLLRHPDLERLDGARRDAEAWAATMPDLQGASDDDLLAWVRTYPPRLGESMQRLLESGMLGAAPRSLLEQLVDRRGGASPGLVNRIVAGTGDVDSAQPARRMWSLGRLVAGDAELTAAFDAGLDGIVERIAGTALEPGIDGLPPRPRPSWQRRVRARLASVGDGPAARLRRHRPPPPRPR